VDDEGELAALHRLVGDFADRREWRQYHNPKNLAMALAAEAGEVLDIFQWLTPEESATIMGDPVRGAHVRSELADVFAYLLQLAASLGVDLAEALDEKMALNELRFPVETTKGRRDKYE
jgi:NTP pyrophosphatase (non-canonical NTP hydrolase)